MDAPKLPNRTTYQGKLIIFTSFYDYRGHAPYIQSLLKTAIVLERLGVNWDFWPTYGDFHIERAINEAYTRFLADPEATDILCIDSDESWDPMAILRMLAHQEDVVCGAYRMKNNWERWTVLLKHEDGQPIGRILGDGTALLEADRVPWGFLRVKREALERYRDHFTDLRYQGAAGETVIFCQQQYRDGHFFSQDYVFSERLKEVGYQLWCDPNMTITHYGNSQHEGNLDQTLRELKVQQAEEAKLSEAAAIVAQMAADIDQRKSA